MTSAKGDLIPAERMVPWASSLILHVLLLITLLLVPSANSAQQRAPYARTVVVMPLFYRPPAPVEPVAPAPDVIDIPARVRPQKTSRTAAVRHRLVSLAQPARLHHAVVKPPEPPPQVALQLSIPTVPQAAPLPPRVVAASVKAGTFDSPRGTPKERAAATHPNVQTGGFDGADNAIAADPRKSAGNDGASGVRTGGFGDSQGSHGGERPQANSRPVVVAEAGFGNPQAAAIAPRRVEAAPAETPVEVFWKPKPQYTDEARARKLEGTVTLEVVFQATGTVRVLRIVHRLGCGLDESARAAAEQIRFTPGRKDGIPVDRTGMVQILFALS